MTKLKEKLPALAGECAEQHGSVDIFYITNIMKFEYDIEDLEWKDKRVLGSGSFATVFESKIIRKDRCVALKVGLY